MLVREDIARLWWLRDERYAVQVVQHSHVPRESTKFLNRPQTRYEKTNWSSVMLFNNARCRALSADFVNQASGLELPSKRDFVDRYRWTLSRVTNERPVFVSAGETRPVL